MKYELRPLCPADFFSLLGLLRKSMANKEGHYIDPLKFYPRFLKPTKELMENHIGAFYGDKLIAASSCFYATFEFENKKINVAEIVISSAKDTNESIILNLASKAEEKAKMSGCDVLYTTDLPFGENLFPVASKAKFNIKRCDICDDFNINAVYAFMNPRVLTNRDKESLKSLFTSLPHQALDTDSFIASLSSRNREPIVVKDSKGVVAGILLLNAYNTISDCYFRSSTEIKEILKAYLIFYQLESLTLSFSPLNKELLRVFSHLGTNDTTSDKRYYKPLNDDITNTLKKFGNYIPEIL